MLTPPLLESEDVRLLTQIGFIASARADVPRAQLIFDAVLHARPERSMGYLGIAIAQLNAGLSHEAVNTLQKAAMPPGEEADMIGAFLGLALQMDARTSDSIRMLRQVADGAGAQCSPPTPGALLAMRLLGEIPSGPDDSPASPNADQ